MPKWLTAIFALFLSIQVFGARGKAVDKFLGSCFNADTVSRVQQSVPQKSSGYFWIRPARKTRLSIFSQDYIFLSEPPVVNPEGQIRLPLFQHPDKY